MGMRILNVPNTPYKRADNSNKDKPKSKCVNPCDLVPLAALPTYFCPRLVQPPASEHKLPNKKTLISCVRMTHHHQKAEWYRTQFHPTARKPLAPCDSNADAPNKAVIIIQSSKNHPFPYCM
jgi:hypothetical protein